MSAGPAPEPGAELGGRYRLESLLGTGGMATVWRAHDAETDREVAVKVLSDSLAHDPDYVKRFAREAETAAGLSHPGVIPVTDFEAGGSARPYLVMELCDGGTLADQLESGAGVDAEPLAEQLLEALEHIHGAGIIHRDIKPANVLLDASGSARLTDFGIAQPLEATRYTAAGEVVGTVRYMAPEVREGQPSDERSDLYSLGVMLSDCRPADRLRPLADRLAAEDPGDRPGSAAEALEALAEARAGDASPTRRTTTATVRLGAGAGSNAAEPDQPTRDLTISLTAGRIAAVLAAATLLVVAVLLFGGGDGGGKNPGKGRAAGGVVALDRVPSARPAASVPDQFWSATSVASTSPRLQLS